MYSSWVPSAPWREGKEVELRGVSSRSVLARLALSPGTAVSIDTLTEALCDDATQRDRQPSGQHQSAPAGSAVSRLARFRAAIDSAPRFALTCWNWSRSSKNSQAVR